MISITPLITRSTDDVLDAVLTAIVDDQCPQITHLITRSVDMLDALLTVMVDISVTHLITSSTDDDVLDTLLTLQCGNMAREGLRTLVVAKKVLTEEQYQDFEVSFTTVYRKCTHPLHRHTCAHCCRIGCGVIMKHLHLVWLTLIH